jgi:phosphatidylserine/phosphatidylglycerophosphate/cardiolipin synthase-like enzyme
MKAVEIDDGKMMTLGSFNQDHWSFYCNNEANIFVKRKSNIAGYKAHRQFVNVFNRLKEECRPVDFTEAFSPAGYIENTFWQLVLNVSHIIANNRKAKSHQSKTD